MQYAEAGYMIMGSYRQTSVNVNTVVGVPRIQGFKVVTAQLASSYSLKLDVSC